MNTKFDWEKISFTIIAYAGEAKGYAMQAINEAKIKNFTNAYQLIESAENSCVIAEKAHMDVITSEAQGQQIEFKVIFMHAEDQLLTTQTIILLAKEFIEVYKKI